MTVHTESPANRILFEIINGRTVAFRRSDMADAQIRAQLVILLAEISRVDLDDGGLTGMLAGVPAYWGDFLTISVSEGEDGAVRGRIAKARSELGKSGRNNPFVTRIKCSTVH
jgi:hypothetical protein